MVSALLPPASVLDVPHLQSPVEGSGNEPRVVQEDTAGDAVAAAHQRLHFLFTGRRKSLQLILTRKSWDDCSHNVTILFSRFFS